MGEPDLDAEKMVARAESGKITVQRFSLSDDPQSVQITGPDGTSQNLNLSKTGDGIYTGIINAQGQGAYRMQSGEISTIAAIGALNPREFADLAPTGELLAPLSDATGGNTIMMSGRALPDIKRVANVKAGEQSESLDLIAHNEYVVKASKLTPLVPGLVFFGLFFLSLAWAWRAEGR